MSPVVVRVQVLRVIFAHRRQELSLFWGTFSNLKLTCVTMRASFSALLLAGSFLIPAVVVAAFKADGCSG